MSHTTSIKGIKIVSISALRAAVAELNTQGIKCSLIDHAVPRAYFPNQPGMGLADHVLKLEASPYDIGLYKQEDGSYEPRTDFYGNHITKLFGVTPSDKEKADQAKLGKLFQMYGIHAATEVARKQGKTVRRISGKDGAIKLEITGY